MKRNRARGPFHRLHKRVWNLSPPAQDAVVHAAHGRAPAARRPQLRRRLCPRGDRARAFRRRTRRRRRNVPRRGRFDRNNAAHAGRIVKFKGCSRDYFAAHRDEERFDFIYVDGSHFVDDVVHDAFDAFAALKVGGVMIFDDYLWRHYSDPLDNPAAAVAALVRVKAGSCRILRAYQQVVLVKTHGGRSEPRA